MKMAWRWLFAGVMLMNGTTMAGELASGIRLPKIFSDHMVVQRGQPVPVWGWAEQPGRVAVRLAGKEQTVTCEPDGAWRVELPPMSAGGPFVMEVEGDETITLQDVMVGEVWLASGQSNIEWPVSMSDNAATEIAAADHPEIRLFHVPRTTSFQPLEDVAVSGWAVCSPASVEDFSATAYFFGRELQQRLNVPVGLIEAAWGGTPIESWSRRAMLEESGDFDELYAEIDRRFGGADPRVAAKQYETELTAWRQQVLDLDAGTARGQYVWQQMNFDDGRWETINLPGRWEESVLPGFDGVVWFRREVSIPDSWTSGTLRVNLGPIDDQDVTWLNGRQIGAQKTWNAPRQYEVVDGGWQAGRNVITVRVVDLWQGGGFWGAAEDMYIENEAGEQIPLGGPWRYSVGLAMDRMPPKPRSPEDPWWPSVLYNGMIAPVAGYGIRGAIWNQGSSNADRPEQYGRLFPAMIRDWRGQWGMGDFPFLFLQLANFIEPNPNADWPALREAQAKALVLSNTAMAVSLDIGTPDDIHPRNKQEFSRRLALLARNRVYGEPVRDSGPVMNRIEANLDDVRVFYGETGAGLTTTDGQAVLGFELAEADGRFVSARAEIDGETVKVSTTGMNEPRFIRYAWDENPSVNLVNESGLPAAPFRTAIGTDQ